MAAKDSLAEIAKLPPEARAYLTSLQKKIEMYDKMKPGAGSNVRKAHMNESKRLASGKGPNKALGDKKYGPPAGSKPKPTKAAAKKSSAPPRKATASTSKTATSKATTSKATASRPSKASNYETVRDRNRAASKPSKTTSKTTTSKMKPSKKKRGAVSGSVIGSAYRQFEKMEPGRSISKLFK